MKYIETYDTPAKINLFLKIVDRLDSGYHLIETIFLPIDSLFDSISISVSEGNSITIICDNYGVPTDANNICYQAAELYLKRIGKSAMVNITIEKRIPIAAGLGGGSSDAAAIILLLNDWHKNFHQHELSQEEMIEIALSVGADVPFFLNPKPAFASGVGEKLSPLERELSPLYLLLVNPQFPISAAEAYKLYSADSEIQQAIPDWSEIKDLELEELVTRCSNSLEEAIVEKYIALQVIRDELYSFGAGKVQLSGSGPTMFATFANSEEMKVAAKLLNDNHPTFFLHQAVID